jgi:type I pantothenate kinase
VIEDPLGGLAVRLLDRFEGDGPHVVGIGGAVAVGKSTVAEGLARRLHVLGRRVEIVATDAFLYPNAVLAERGLLMRKGFPETYDFGTMVRVVRELRSGGRAEVAVYSHEAYDIVPGEVQVIEGADLVLLEGIVALQPPVVDELDASIYIDAAEADVREWYVARFLTLAEAAGEGSFYGVFAGMAPDEVRAVAEATWEEINGVNLREHIAPSRTHATFVVLKGRDHSVSEVVG